MANFQIKLEHAGKTALVRSDAGVSLAINQTFADDQPNHFATPDASRRDYEADGFVGNTTRGGSCNVDVLTVIPHCNGTHTETMAHIVRGDYFIGKTLRHGPLLAQLITVECDSANDCVETYDPPLAPNDKIVTAERLKAILDSVDLDKQFCRPEALIIRTLPNDETKRSREYSFDSPPPFLTNNAMTLILEFQFKHLLLDLPSVDRMQDKGRLSNHCLFWSVDVETRVPKNESTWNQTISEMIYAPEALRDGLYLLDLQVCALNTDASPSRPLLFPIEIQG